ncbi:MAG: response regulator [Lachnospiraceae bacterium]|nr:response regulator [Lachnospiraceae bacterium]
MAKSQVLVIGAKETFLIRILVKKINDAGLEGVYVGWSINDINARWDETALITFYMDEGERPPRDVLHFLVDRAADEGKKLIPISEQNDMQFLVDHIPGDIIYKSFVRPLNNEEYIKTVRELLDKADAGEFRKSILIVDDDANYLGLVREWLKDTYKVAIVNSGLQAIKWLGNNKADLILLDYEMPVTTGPKVLEMLRHDVETSSIPVIFLTGKGDKESVMAVVALKPEGYFLKSIEREELLTKLKEFFVLHK